MLFDNIVLSKNSWHFKFLTWVWGEKPKYTNFCPYFWLTIASILLVWVKLFVLFILAVHAAHTKLMGSIMVNRFIKKVNERFIKDGNAFRGEFYYYDEFETFQTAYKPPAPYEYWTQLLILQYCMAKRGIKVFIDTVPEEIMLLDHSELYYRQEKIEEYYTEEYKAYLLKIQKKLDVKKIQELKAYEPDALDRLADRISKFIGTINLPTKNTLIIGTKVFFKYLFYALIPVILVAIVYGLYHMVLYTVSHTEELLLTGQVTLFLAVIFFTFKLLVTIIKYIFSTFSITLRLNGLLTPLKKIGKFFKVLYLSMKTVFSFFAAGFMLWKADNCPSITWTDELNTEENA